MYHINDWKAATQNFEFKHEADEKAKAEAAAKFERERAENKEIGSGGWLYGASNSISPQNGAVPSRFMPPKDWARPTAEYQNFMGERPRPHAFYEKRGDWPVAPNWPAAPKPEVGWSTAPKPENDWSSSGPKTDDNIRSRSRSPKREVEPSQPSPSPEKIQLHTSDNHCDAVQSKTEVSETGVQGKTEESDTEEPAKVEDCAPSGWLYRATWALQEDLSIEYAIRLGDSSQPDSVPDVDDVFVSLDQAAKLLTTCAGPRVKPPNIKTIWSVTLHGESEEIDFCPLTEFVYHTALKGKKFKKLFDGILKEIVRALYNSREEAENANNAVKYAEKSIKVKDYHEGRKVKNVSYDEDDNDNDNDANWEDMTTLMNQDLAAQLLKEEIKIEPGENDSDESDEYQDEENYEEPRPVRKRKKKLKPPEDEDDKPIKKRKKGVKGELGTKRAKVEKPESYLCDVCEFSTKTKVNLQLHMRYHDEANKLHCPHCEFSTFQKGRMKSHVNSVHLGIPFQCDKCDYSDFSEVKVRFHKKAVHKGEVYQCEQCSYTTIYPNSLVAHQKAMHPTEEDKHACPACDYVTTSAINLKNHRERTHENITFTCEQCGKPFKSKQSLQVHKNTVHATRAEFMCDLCDYTSNHKKSFKTHVMVKHEGKSFHCKDPNCSFTANHPSSINEHWNVVHLKKTYNCDICSFQAQGRKELTRHKNKHKQDILAGVAGVARNMAARNMAAYHH